MGAKLGDRAYGQTVWQKILDLAGGALSIEVICHDRASAYVETAQLSPL